MIILNRSKWPQVLTLVNRDTGQEVQTTVHPGKQTLADAYDISDMSRRQLSHCIYTVNGENGTLVSILPTNKVDEVEVYSDESYDIDEDDQ